MVIVVPLDHDVTRQVAEDRDSQPEGDDEAGHEDDRAQHDEGPAEALDPIGAHPPGGASPVSPSAERASAGASQRLGMSGSPRRGGGIS